MPPAATRVLITGCSGYVGHQLASLLADAGLRVFGTSRRPVALDNVEVFAGDHRSPDFVKACLNKVDVVLHCAARTRGHDAAVFQADNEDVTRLFARYSRDLGKKIVYFSSDQAVYRGGYYGRSKFACEEIVTAEADNYAVLRLTAVLGRYAPDMNSTFSRIIRRLNTARFLTVPGDASYPIAPVWIGDIVVVLLQLMSRPHLPNRTLEICGDVLSLGALLDLFEARLGVHRTRLSVPLKPLQMAARTLKPFSIFSRLPLDALLDLGRPVGVSYRDLGELTGFRPTPMAQAVSLIEGFPEPHRRATREGVR